MDGSPCRKYSSRWFATKIDEPTAGHGAGALASSSSWGGGGGIVCGGRPTNDRRLLYSITWWKYVTYQCYIDDCRLRPAKLAVAPEAGQPCRTAQSPPNPALNRSRRIRLINQSHNNCTTSLLASAQSVINDVKKNCRRFKWLCDKTTYLNLLFWHRRTHDFTMERFTESGSRQFPKGAETGRSRGPTSFSGVQGNSSGRGLGDEAESKCEISVQL